MHHKYHSQGFVLANFNSGESNKAYKIFTRELGLVIASAQSARASHSKLKASLTNYTCGFFTFIQTRRGWRITGASVEKNLYFDLKNDPKFLVSAKIFFLIQKLLPDEDPNTELFDSFSSDIDFLFSNNFSNENLKNFECVIILKILSYLGYLDKVGQWQNFIKNEGVDLDLIGNFSPFRKQAIKEINNSFRESQLV